MNRAYVDNPPLVVALAATSGSEARGHSPCALPARRTLKRGPRDRERAHCQTGGVNFWPPWQCAPLAIKNAVPDMPRLPTLPIRCATGMTGGKPVPRPPTQPRAAAPHADGRDLARPLQHKAELCSPRPREMSVAARIVSASLRLPCSGDLPTKTAI